MYSDNSPRQYVPPLDPDRISQTRYLGGFHLENKPVAEAKVGKATEASCRYRHRGIIDQLNTSNNGATFTMTLERSRDYELIMIVSPEADDDEVEATHERVDSLVEGNGGKVTHHETWGLRRLAYPIKKFQEGNYLLSRFTATPVTATEVNRTLDADQKVIRHLVVKS